MCVHLSGAGYKKLNEFVKMFFFKKKFGVFRVDTAYFKIDTTNSRTKNFF